MSLINRFVRVLGWFVALAAVATASAADNPEPPQTRAPGIVEARFTDGSVLKLTLKAARVEVVTPYGRLTVPVGEIQRIDFATRLADDMARRIDEAVANLAHPQFTTREAATAELFKLKEKAYPALLDAAKVKDAEVSSRATELLDRIRDAVPAEQLEVRKFDVIQTEHSKFSGRIEGSVLQVASAQFGDVQLKLTDLRTLRIPGLTEDEGRVAQADPDPGALTNYHDKVGKTFYFKVTGATTATIWGTDVYTTDSQLATAAVHAGALQAGETGVVKVTILPSPPVFNGASRNGVTSLPYGAFPAAYKVSKRSGGTP
jgi:hypothetical protein